MPIETNARKEEESNERTDRPEEGLRMRSRMTAPVSAGRRAAIMQGQQINPRLKDYIPRHINAREMR